MSPARRESIGAGEARRARKRAEAGESERNDLRMENLAFRSPRPLFPSTVVSFAPADYAAPFIIWFAGRCDYAALISKPLAANDPLSGCRGV